MKFIILILLTFSVTFCKSLQNPSSQSTQADSFNFSFLDKFSANKDLLKKIADLKENNSLTIPLTEIHASVTLQDDNQIKIKTSSSPVMEVNGKITDKDSYELTIDSKTQKLLDLKDKKTFELVKEIFEAIPAQIEEKHKEFLNKNNSFDFSFLNEFSANNEMLTRIETLKENNSFTIPLTELRASITFQGDNQIKIKTSSSPVIEVNGKITDKDSYELTIDSKTQKLLDLKDKKTFELVKEIFEAIPAQVEKTHKEFLNKNNSFDFSFLDKFSANKDLLKKIADLKENNSLTIPLKKPKAYVKFQGDNQIKIKTSSSPVMEVNGKITDKDSYELTIDSKTQKLLGLKDKKTFELVKEIFEAIPAQIEEKHEEFVTSKEQKLDLSYFEELEIELKKITDENDKKYLAHNLIKYEISGLGNSCWLRSFLVTFLLQLFEDDVLFDSAIKKIEDITSDEKTFKGYPKNSDINFKFDTFNQWGKDRKPLGVRADEVVDYLKALKTKKDDFSWIPIIAQKSTPNNQKLLKFFRKLCSVLQFLDNYEFRNPELYKGPPNLLQRKLNNHINISEGGFPGSAAHHITLANYFKTSVYSLSKTHGIGTFGEKDSRDGTIKRTKLLEPLERYKKQRVFIYDSKDNHYDILLHKDIIEILKNNTN